MNEIREIYIKSPLRMRFNSSKINIRQGTYVQKLNKSLKVKINIISVQVEKFFDSFFFQIECTHK